MNTEKKIINSLSINGLVQLALSIIAIIVFAVCYSSPANSLFATTDDFTQVLAPFATQNTGDFLYWISWAPIVLTIVFFAVVISNQLTRAMAGPGTTILFYLSAITVAFSVYFKIASMALEYIAVTPLAGTTDFNEIMKYGILAMPLVIVACTVAFSKISQRSWIKDYSALSWCLYVSVMLILGAFTPAFIYLLCLIVFWLVLGALSVVGIVLGVIVAIVALYLALIVNR